MRPVAVIVTCEHAGYRVPAKFVHLFRNARQILASHRGWDPGAAELARQIQRTIHGELHLTNISRLLIETNRSLHHRHLFSEFTKALAPATRTLLVNNYYQPYRSAVIESIGRHVKQGYRVWHLSIHSFTPQLNDKVRRADVGLLYDPRRSSERVWAATWHSCLQALRPDLVIRRNYPYQGKADGFTTFLRTQFNVGEYAGIELEVNQSWPLGPTKTWRQLRIDLCQSIAATLATLH